MKVRWSGCHDDFGMSGIFAVTGAKDNLGRIPSSSGWDWIVANPDLAKAYDKYIYYFFPADKRGICGPGCGWRSHRLARIAERTRTDGGGAQPVARHAEGADHQQVRQWRHLQGGCRCRQEAAAANFGDASRYKQKDIATPDQFPTILDQMLKKPEFMNQRPAAYALT